jgi:hypothetical protein
VTPDRNPKTVALIKPNLLDRSGFSIGEYDGLANKLCVRVLKRAEYRRKRKFSQMALKKSQSADLPQIPLAPRGTLR